MFVTKITIQTISTTVNINIQISLRKDVRFLSVWKWIKPYP